MRIFPLLSNLLFDSQKLFLRMNIFFSNGETPKCRGFHLFPRNIPPSLFRRSQTAPMSADERTATEDVPLANEAVQWAILTQGYPIPVPPRHASVPPIIPASVGVRKSACQP